MAETSRPAVTVLGAGSWGTALAILLARNGVAVKLWDRDEDHIEQMDRNRANQRYLPGIELPALVAPLADLPTALEHTDYVLIVVPSSGFRSVL